MLHALEQFLGLKQWGDTQNHTAVSLKEVLEGLHHFLENLRVGDGVEQMSLVRLVKYWVPRNLQLILTILQKDSSAQGLCNVSVGRVTWLDNMLGNDININHCTYQQLKHLDH